MKRLLTLLLAILALTAFTAPICAASPYQPSGFSWDPDGD